MFGITAGLHLVIYPLVSMDTEVWYQSLKCNRWGQDTAYPQFWLRLSRDLRQILMQDYTAPPTSQWSTLLEPPVCEACFTAHQSSGMVML